MPVAVGGLLVNLVGLLCFHEHYHPSRGGGESCGCQQHAERGGENMRGVLLHMLADVMGSVSALVSCALSRYLGWHRADPICSLVLATVIAISVIAALAVASLKLRDEFVSCTTPLCRLWAHAVDSVLTAHYLANAMTCDVCMC